MNAQTAYLVVNDQDALAAVKSTLRRDAVVTDAYKEPRAFLAACRQTWHGCLLLDLRPSDGEDLAVLAELRKRCILLPVVFVTNQGEVAVAVRAMQLGALTVLERPLAESQLQAAVRDALAEDARRQTARRRVAQAVHLLQRLSLRERQVLDLFVSGLQTKQIAKQLGISEKTVAAHRARMFDKLGVGSVVELVHLAAHAGAFEPAPPPGIRST